MSEILNFGQRSKQKVKVKVKVNWSRVKVNGYWSGSVLGFQVGSRVAVVELMTSSYDVSLTWLMTCLGLTWLLLAWLVTWTDDVR